MLKCAKNFKCGLGGPECRDCGETDDENHRINYCSRFKELNLYSSPIKFDFDGIFSDDDDSVSRTLEVVDHLWNGKPFLSSGPCLKSATLHEEGVCPR